MVSRSLAEKTATVLRPVGVWVLLALLVAPAVRAEPRAGLVSFRRLPIPDDVPAHLSTALVQDRQGFLWIGTQAGLVRHDGYQFKVFKPEPDDPRSLGGSYVRTLLAAADGRLWVGTFSDGLSVYDSATESFTRYRHSPEDPRSLSHDRVEGLAEDRSGRVWVATYEGLDRIDPRSGRIDHFRHATGDPRSLADDRVRALLVDRDGRLWVGSRDGLQVWNGAAQGFERLSTAQRLPGGPIRAMTFGPDGELWIGAAEGLARIDPGSSRAVSFRHRPEDPSTLSGHAVEAIAVGVDGTLWVGTDSGLNAFDRKRGTAVRILYEPGQRDGLPNNWVPALMVASDGRLWVATQGGAAILTGWDGRTARFEPVAERMGRAPASVYRWRVRRLQARGRELERLVGERTRELEAAYARIEEASLTDPLTRARNRRYLEQAIGTDVELAARRHEDGANFGTVADESDLVFLLLDLDHFKSVNDTYGHEAGDAVLVQTAEVLRASFRASDAVVRWGGEEFLLVARFVNRREAPALAEKVRAAIEAHPFRLGDGRVLRRTCSIGFAVYPLAPTQPRAVDWEEVVALADLGLYAVKRNGRNGWMGIESALANDPQEAVRLFREDPQAAATRSAIRVRASISPR